MDFDSLFSDIGSMIVDRLRAEMQAMNLNASGLTSESINFQTNEKGLSIYANQSIMTLVKGRQPTTNSGDGEVLKRITEWVKQRGIEEKAAYAIAKKIHEQGIKIPNAYNDGKLFERVFTQELQNEIRKKINKFIYGNTTFSLA